MAGNIKTIIGRYVAGEMADIEAKAEILRQFPGCRTEHQAMLLADYIDELLAQALADSQAIVEAFDKLRASEAARAS